jgi:hypothetical protein
VKRLILLLIVLAGGLAAAAFAVPSNAASVDGVGIGQNRLSSDLSAIANSSPYECLLNAQQAVGTDGASGLPPIDGAGQSVGSGSHPTITSSFAGTYLDTLIGHQLVFELAAKDHVRVTSADLSTARTQLLAQIKNTLTEVTGSKFACEAGTTARAVLASMPSSFVSENVRFDATVTKYAAHLGGIATSTAGLQGYYGAHGSEFDTACFTVAEYTSESAAEAASAQVTAGTPFATVAAGVSGGGPQGCEILSGIASELPAAQLQSLAVNAVTPPIQSGSSYLLIQITSESPTPFAKARSEVEAAVRSVGDAKAQDVIDRVEKTATISVDQRYGSWVPGQAQVLPPVAPLPADVLNPSVNDSSTATSTTTPATGQTP